ncbi:hypothetical protein GCM10011581_14350 [Saccharopolyspora subtropica]|uniref:Uncharacterized protein n=1 Tax=Saccharopolyspora thermophila TaxID=89367 RepID=A0A917JN54_9PSEU|nr:DUF5336 domain-containing protein [Saccharopolyspora subtropica]GGI78398.1 hypothetical protein GCM10011581_14350 [Saccharopolyspora subtropica]
MSAFPQSPPSASPESTRLPLGIREILALVAAGAGLIGYLIGFFDEAAGVVMGSLTGFALICAAALAGLRFVPKTPDCLFAAAPLAAYATLALLQDLVGGTAGGVTVVLLLLTLAQLGGVLGVLLIDGGILTLPSSQPSQPSKPAFGQPGPFQPGKPGAPGGPGGPGWPTGQPAQPGTGGWSPVGTQPPQPGGWVPASGSQPGQPAAPSHTAQSGPAPSGQNQSGQPGQGGSSSGQHGQSGHTGPQGTQQMPHPGANPF